ncbi:hypothetical protein [Nocardia asiatica]|uniref:hypothetical protein n=1 Tax=Nocardia asiatica TaxID=209252 RepID=UPI002454C56E|nr:hypothetical protein [Nocardia asiatica]
MATYGMVKVRRARFTVVDRCGMPIAGPRSRLTTSGLITLTASPVMRDAEELEQTNGEGRVCVSDRTPAERKWWNIGLELCKVNTCLYNMLLDWKLVTSWEGKPIGFTDKRSGRPDRGVAVEIWTGVGAEDECDEIPTTDDILLTGAAGDTTKYGYLAWPAVREFALGADLDLGAKVSTFKLNGITNSPTRWGLSPYNLMAADASNTPRRMLEPIEVGAHHISFETTVAPPEADEDCCPLVLPSPYYGETAATTAPSQPACGAVGSNEIQTVTITGSPTGGTFSLTYQGATTTPLAYNAAAAAVQAALEALSTIGEDNVTVTGSAGGPYTVEFVGDLAELNLPLMTKTANLTGGTSPNVTIAQSQAGGVY